MEAEGKTAEAEQVIEEAVEAPPALAPVPSGPVRGDLAGTASFIKEGRWKVTDETKVPREWLCLDEKKIGAAVKPSADKGGLRNIPGLEIWEEEGMINR